MMKTPRDPANWPNANDEGAKEIESLPWAANPSYTAEACSKRRRCGQERASMRTLSRIPGLILLTLASLPAILSAAKVTVYPGTNVDIN